VRDQKNIIRKIINLGYLITWAQTIFNSERMKFENTTQNGIYLLFTGCLKADPNETILCRKCV